MMLLASGSNQIILTLNDSYTLDDPEFVIVFVNEDSKKKCACKLGSDLSLYPTRFNKYQLTVKSSPNPLNAEIELLNYGRFLYYVYEREDADTFDFTNIDTTDLSTLEGKIEEGIMDYSQTFPAVEYYKNHPSSIKVYA